MLQQTPAARPGIGPSVLSTPLGKTIRQSQFEPPATRSAAGAGLSIEDDFDLGSDFLLVFTRASERIAGFVVGCAAIGIVWVTFSLL